MKSTRTSVLKVETNEKGMEAEKVANDIDLGHGYGFSYFLFWSPYLEENIYVSSWKTTYLIQAMSQ
jgi:hypothetical protein